MIDKKDLFVSDIDEDIKSAFLSMQREDQLLAIMNMQSWIRAELAVMKKSQIGYDQDLRDFKKELREVRYMREQKERDKESHGDELLNTTQKILKAIAAAEAGKFNYAVWFRDRVLPQVIALITLAVLYLTFGSKLP